MGAEAEGLWVIKHWAPWLDPLHPRPARPGELRWFTTGSDGEEVDGRGPHLVAAKRYGRGRGAICRRACPTIPPVTRVSDVQKGVSLDWNGRPILRGVAVMDFEAEPVA
jgi:hypothetical protein